MVTYLAIAVSNSRTGFPELTSLKPHGGNQQEVMKMLITAFIVGKPATIIPTKGRQSRRFRVSFEAFEHHVYSSFFDSVARSDSLASRLDATYY